MNSDKIREQEYKQRAMWSSITIVAALTAFVFMVFWGDSPVTGTLFSSWLSLGPDLSGCELSFAHLLRVATTLSIGLGVVSAGLVISNVLDIYSDKRSFPVYRKHLLVGTCLAVFLVLPLVFGDGAWDTGGHHGVPRIDLATACAASHHATFYRLHGHLLIVMLLGWVNILVMLNLRWMIVDQNTLTIIVIYIRCLPSSLGELGPLTGVCNG